MNINKFTDKPTIGKVCAIQSVDIAHVKKLMKVIQSGIRLKVKIAPYKDEARAFRVVDGHHTLRAYYELGYKIIPITKI